MEKNRNIIEEWRDVVGYEGRYRVSDQGRVKSLDYNRTGKERVLKPEKDEGGYLTVAFSKEGSVKRFLVHRLVAQTFIQNPNNYPQVNHKDEEKTNNCVENLEWCTSSYNINYGTHIERQIATRNARKSYGAEQPVIATRNGTEQWFKSQNEAARRLGLKQGSIHFCLVGRFRQTGGYSFRLATQSDRPLTEPLF